MAIDTFLADVPSCAISASFPSSFGGPDPGDIATGIGNLLSALVSFASCLSSAANQQSAAAVEYAEQSKANKLAAAAFTYDPSVVEPVVDIPTSASTEINLIQIEPLLDYVVDKMNGLFIDFYTTYFPGCDCTEAAKDWMCDVINNGYSGIPANIEALIYQRDKDRIEGEYDKALDEATSLWANRGFSMPGGTLLAMQNNLRLNADKAQAEASRNLAVKHHDVVIDMTKLAVQAATDLRTKEVTAAAQYISALSTGMDVVSKAIVVQQDAQAKLISAAADFFRARISAEELELKAKMLPAELEDKSIQRYHEQLVRLLDHANNAMQDAAKNMATQASATLNALHTGANLSLGVNL